MRTNRHAGVDYPTYFASHLMNYRKSVRQMASWSIIAQIRVDEWNCPIYEKLGRSEQKIGILEHNYHYTRYLRLRMAILRREQMRRWESNPVRPSVSPKEVNGSLV